MLSSAPVAFQTLPNEISAIFPSSEWNLRLAWKSYLQIFHELASKFLHTAVVFSHAATDWLSPTLSKQWNAPLLASAAMAINTNSSDILDGKFPATDPGSESHPHIWDQEPGGPVPENESITNAAAILIENFHKGQCQRLCAELVWLAPEEMSQVLSLAVKTMAPEHIISHLSLIADDAAKDHEHLMILELTIGGLALSSFDGGALKTVLEKLGRTAPDHERRETAWNSWSDSLNETLNSWNEKDPSATARIDGLLASIRSSTWRTGYASPIIDRLISVAPFIDARQRNIGRYFLYAAGYLIHQRSMEKDLARRFLEIQYATDRIAACGDLARAKMILSETIQEFRIIEKQEPSVRVSYFIRRLQSLHDGVMTVLNFTTVLNTISLTDAISLYRSPDYLQVPPVHIVIRGLRRNAAALIAKGKSKETLTSQIHATARELAQIRIIDSILGDHLTDPKIKNIHDRLLEALGAGESVGQQEWAILLTESVDLLYKRNLLFQAHDLMRALQKLDVCDSRFFSSLCMTMVTNVEILRHKTTDPELRVRLSELRDRLVEWQETCDA